jgi:thiol-disulfide isomerase/thioredoxin
MKRVMIFVAFAFASLNAFAQEKKHAPPLTLKSVEGRAVRLTEFRGKVVLLNFWATWCPPCRAEMPDLVKLQRDYAKQGLQVVGVTYPPETRGAVRRFARKLGVNYPVALGTKATKSLFSETETLPVTIVIDRDGNIRDTIEGILLPEEFEQKIKPLLKQSAPGVASPAGISGSDTHHQPRLGDREDAEKQNNGAGGSRHRPRVRRGQRLGGH